MKLLRETMHGRMKRQSRECEKMRMKKNLEQRAHRENVSMDEKYRAIKTRNARRWQIGKLGEKRARTGADECTWRETRCAIVSSSGLRETRSARLIRARRNNT